MCDTVRRAFFPWSAIFVYLVSFMKFMIAKFLYLVRIDLAVDSAREILNREIWSRKICIVRGNGRVPCDACKLPMTFCWTLKMTLFTEIHVNSKSMQGKIFINWCEF